MALVSDKRGSNDQRTLFNWTKELYPSSKVHYEYALPDGSRIDIFIPVFGIAIEYDGRQHYKYVEHFHKDISGYIEGIKKDAGKDTWCEEHGIKVIRIRADDMLSSKEELEQLILNTPYPNKEYIPIDIEPIEEKPLSEYEEKQLAYKNKKNEQLRQLRKEQYQKYKQSKKK